MKALAKNAITNVIQSIDWIKIKQYHKRLGIIWIFESENQKVERIPTVKELKNDLRKLLEHMYEEKLTYISYGNWIVFWDGLHNSVGDIRIIFRLADFVFESQKIKEKLESALSKAIENEDYEYAALLRDELNNKEK